MKVQCTWPECHSYAEFMAFPHFWRCSAGHYFTHNPPKIPVDIDESKGITSLPEEPRAHARRSDPDTSHAAAASVNVTKKQAEVLDALSHIDEPGATSEELCDFAGKPWNSVTPRLRPLQRQGMIRENGRKRASTRRMQIIWMITLAGVDWLSEHGAVG